MIASLAKRGTGELYRSRGPRGRVVGGDAMETEEERRKRLGMVAQQRGQLTQNASPAANSLFGGLGGTGGTGRLF